MEFHSTVGITLLLGTVLSVAADNSSCPASTTPVVNTHNKTTWCVRDLGANRSFCQAVQDCHSIGEEMISREVYFAMKDSSFAAPLRYWVGLTDALEERNSNKDGWVWIRDGHKTETSGSGFRHIEPQGTNEDCVCFWDGGLCDIACTEPQFLRTLCYSKYGGSPVLPTNDRTIGIYGKVEIVNFIQPDPGCWINESSNLITNRVQCSFRCHMLGLDCVGFYWNSARQECIILPYFDASVPLSFNTELERLKWEKFLKKSTV